ncbi:hypothetical protein DOY81_012800, partial [Sarcophaga bullata]
YAAGFKTVADVAKTRPIDLIILMKKLDHLEEETEALKVCLKPDNLIKEVSK